MDSKRICFYYQQFSGLDQILMPDGPVTDITVSSIHFGHNQDGSLYIHLNDNDPSDSCFDQMWQQTLQAIHLGIGINLMIGGAGGAYEVLFSDFDMFYPLLKRVLQEHPQISGVNLDVEEEVSLDNIKKLIRAIKQDFPLFQITMAPLQTSLATDQPGMGGFSYKELYNSPEGQLINYFNVQIYGEYSLSAFEQCVNNGYPPEKLMMCMLSGQLSSTNAAAVAKEVVNNYPTMAGVADWEFFNTIPSPIQWALKMRDALRPAPPKGVLSWFGW